MSCLVVDSSICSVSCFKIIIKKNVIYRLVYRGRFGSVRLIWFVINCCSVVSGCRLIYLFQTLVKKNKCVIYHLIYRGRFGSVNTVCDSVNRLVIKCCSVVFGCQLINRFRKLSKNMKKTLEETRMIPHNA